MKSIVSIENLNTKCTGCLACEDICPMHCITRIVGDGGFVHPKVDEAKCVSCGKCYTVCPLQTKEKQTDKQRVYAAYSVERSIQNRGSSGGTFELLARHFLAQNFFVVGAAFEGTTLKHRIIHCEEELKPLLKSKYIQSDTSGIYTQVKTLLKKGEKVFFCGTPCQVSALINSIPKELRANVFTADIICHGVPSQKVFDAYIQDLEAKHKGSVSNFSFRVKDNKYKHSNGYSYEVTKNGKTKTINGIYTNASFYNAFKKYLILRDGCYDCQYATVERVSDITLADFWGIEKYDFAGNIDAGVSMIITNTQKGEAAFKAINEQMVRKEFPLQYAIDSNFCLTHSAEKPENRDAIIQSLETNGYTATAKKYFKSGFVQKMYWLVPPKVRVLIRKLRRR